MQFFLLMKTDLKSVLMNIVTFWKSFKLQNRLNWNSFLSIQSYESFFRGQSYLTFFLLFFQFSLLVLSIVTFVSNWIFLGSVLVKKMEKLWVKWVKNFKGKIGSWFRTNLWVAVGIFEHSGCDCNFYDLDAVERSPPLRCSSLECKALQRSDLLFAFSSKFPLCEVWLSLEGDKIVFLSDFLRSIPTKVSTRCSVWN